MYVIHIQVNTLVFSAVLFSAFFQASWNFATKRSKADKVALLAVGWFFFGLLLLGPALYVTPLSAVSRSGVYLMLASGLIHAVYVCFLGWGYTVGEISVVYPIARGLGIAGTTLLCVLLNLNAISWTGFTGIAAIVLGTLLIGLKEVPQQAKRKAFAVALLIALTVSSYSVVDSLGAKEVPNLLYLASMNLLAPLFAGPFLFWKLKNPLITVCRIYKMESFLVALAGTVAYGIVLWAFQQSTTAYVAALREFSVAIAVFLGVIFLKEPLYKRKSAGVLLILAGLVLIKLS